MLFNSISFLYFFLPISFLIYYLIPKKYKNYILLISSFIFYFLGDSKYFILLLLEIMIAYIGGLILKKSNNKYIDILVLSIPILLLGYFKYIDFILKTINNIFNSKFRLTNVILPLGISFYTFQVLSYLIDVKRKKINHEKNIIKLATYISLFPKLISGPITRYDEVDKYLEEKDISLDNIAYGIERFILGLLKKVIIAGGLASLCALYLDSPDKSVIFSLIYALSYTLEVYMDFSAYSDMAIGLGKMLGFTFPENFSYPLSALSITEFWRKWHITLGAWFRDYVYIPLGGSKKGNSKLIRNILVVWFLTGLWHGAAWNFIIWGLYYGIILLVEKLFLKKYLDKIPKVIRHIYVLSIVLVSFVIFSSSDYLDILGNMFFLNNLPFINQVTIYYLKSYAFYIVFGIILSSKSILKIKNNKHLKKVFNFLEPIILIVILLIVTASLIDNSYNPFLYFKF